MPRNVAAHIDVASSGTKPFGLEDGYEKGAAAKAAEKAINATRNANATHVLLDIGKIDALALHRPPDGQMRPFGVLALELAGVPFGREFWEAITIVPESYPMFLYVGNIAGWALEHVEILYRRAEAAGIPGICIDLSGTSRFAKPYINPSNGKVEGLVGAATLLTLRARFPRVQTLVEGPAWADAEGDLLLDLGCVQTASGMRSKAGGTESRPLSNMERMRQHTGARFCTLDTPSEPEKINPLWRGQPFEAYGPRWYAWCDQAGAIPVAAPTGWDLQTCRRKP